MNSQFENITDTQAATALGYTSIAIGLTEFLLPRSLQRLMGIGGPNTNSHTGLLRTLGVREVLHGLHLLSTPDDPTPAVLARCAGDMLDGALLAAAASQTRRPAGLAAVCALVLPVVAADLLLAKRLTRNKYLS